jgi:Ni2+-binding GTPase involved in maturation of urease and hydrogenase
LKIAFSGSHGCGKTTSVFKKCFELKKEYKNVDVLVETARESPFPINRETT